jgi:branched-chain amino acid transport system permease protein
LKPWRVRGAVLLPVALACSALLAWGTSSPYHSGLMVHAAVLGLFGVGINLVFGTMGFVSFGHAAFLGLGAYVAGLGAVKLGWSYWALVPAAVLAGAALGSLVGFASLRLGGAYFAIATLTVAEILRLVSANWIDFTRGPMGVVVPQSPLPLQSWLGVDFQKAYLFSVLAITVLCVFAVARLMAGPAGRAWLAIRESIALAESIGIQTVRWRVINMTLSGGIAALAGALLVPKIFVITPDLFGPAWSATGLLAVILGGRGSLVGPLLGGLIFAVLPEVLRAVEQVRMVVFAALLLGVVWLLPGGLASLAYRRSGGRARDPAPADRPPEADMPPARPAPPVVGAELLVARGLGKSFRGLRAVDRVSLRVAEGEIVGLIGPNGAGKTTCLNMLSGFARPDQGSVRFLGRDIATLAPNRVAALGLVRTFQQTTLFPDLTVGDNILVATHLERPESLLSTLAATAGFLAREAQRAAVARATLETVGLSHRAADKAGVLPYGEQRLLAVALALATRPTLLLLDEPAAGLNHTEAMRLAGLLDRLRASGVAMLVIDHNLKMIMSICDRVVVLHHGEMLAEGTPRAVREDPAVVRAYLGVAQAAAEATHAQG